MLCIIYYAIQGKKDARYDEPIYDMYVFNGYESNVNPNPKKKKKQYATYQISKGLLLLRSCCCCFFFTNERSDAKECNEK